VRLMRRTRDQKSHSLYVANFVTAELCAINRDGAATLVS
jgi:hypothetical protein